MDDLCEKTQDPGAVYEGAAANFAPAPPATAVGSVICPPVDLTKKQRAN